MMERPVPGYGTTLQSYFSSVAELMDLGERREDRAVLTLSLADAKTPRILALLGWKVAQENGVSSIEPGEQAIDGPRQQIPRALGIDEFAMQQELNAGHTFRFEILSENAPLTGGAAWGPVLQGFASLPGGIAEAFARDSRLPRVYAGLGGMQPEVAAALVEHLGIRAMAAIRRGRSLAVRSRLRSSERVGGAEAEAAWTALAGAVRVSNRFWEALLKVDRGRLAAFYAALSKAGATRQKFFCRIRRARSGCMPGIAIPPSFATASASSRTAGRHDS